MQVAIPGRHSLHRGCYRQLFDTIDAIGYSGWIGCEYVPKPERWKDWNGRSRT